MMKKIGTKGLKLYFIFNTMIKKKNQYLKA